MNRQSKRMDDSQDGLDGGGAVSTLDREPVRDARPTRQRTSPAQFAREVRDELRQVAWPTRSELINYTAVVLFTLVVMISLIFLLNYAFGKAVFFMFQK